MAGSELLLRVARCTNVRACLGAADVEHPCSAVVRLQGNKPLAEHQVPEPWSGHIETAPILFVSSNPGYSEEDLYPRHSWSDDEIEAYFARRFEDFITDGVRGRLPDGSQSRQPTQFWVAVKALAAELLDQPKPGLDYALTEVVRCKSLSESEGGGAPVWKAVDTCTDRYLAETLNAAGARLIVVLGSIAAYGVRRLLGIAGEERLLGPLSVCSRERMLAFLPHPNARLPRSLRACLPEHLDDLRRFVRT